MDVVASLDLGSLLGQDRREDVVLVLQLCCSMFAFHNDHERTSTDVADSEKFDAAEVSCARNAAAICSARRCT